MTQTINSGHGVVVKVNLKKQQTEDAVVAGAREMVLKIADTILAESQLLVPRDTGTLAKTGSVNIAVGPTSVTASVGYNTKYAAVMEFGRQGAAIPIIRKTGAQQVTVRTGSMKFPPFRPIYEWLRRHGHSDADARRLYWPVARKIVVMGIDAKKYLRKALQTAKANKALWPDAFKQAIKSRLKGGLRWV